MQLTTSLCWLLTILAMTVSCDGSSALPRGTIQIQSKSSQANVRQSESYHSKQQQPRSYALQGFSETFVKLPGTTLAFHHSEPLLYKVRFEGKCYTPHAASTFLYLHLMVDDYLLYVDRFLSNTAERYNYNAGYPNNHESDQIGGFSWFASSVTLTTCAFSDILYLTPGLHVIDVGVRGGYSAQDGTFPILVLNGVLTAELIQYDRFADIGMRPMNVSQPRSTG